MIVVKVELHLAITGRISEIARLRICNDGTGDNKTGNYFVETFRGRTQKDLERGTVLRRGEVKNHKRLALHVWTLVAKALKSVGYGDGKGHTVNEAGRI